MNLSVELGADPRRKLIKNQTNLLVAATSGDVEKAAKAAWAKMWKTCGKHVEKCGKITFQTGEGSWTLDLWRRLLDSLMW